VVGKLTDAEIAVTKVQNISYSLIMGIPPGISEILLPQDNLNVVDLIDFAIPLGKHKGVQDPGK
jgi:hypothetical protein